jgi:serine protease Do
MTAKQRKILKISIITILFIILITIGLVYFFFKEVLFREVGDSLANLLPKREITFQITPTIKNESEETSIIDAVDNSKQAVVSIFTSESNSKLVGSGVLISSEGSVVTNNQVISNSTQKYFVALGGETYPISQIYIDNSSSLVFAKISGSEFKFLNMGNSNDLKLGQKVISLSSSSDRQSKVSAGIISSFGEDIDTDINSGLIGSGGPILTSKGEFIGISQVKESKGLKSVVAIPTNKIKELQAKYLAQNISSVLGTGIVASKSQKGFLGIGFFFKDLKEYINSGQPIGPVIDGVVSGSPADVAGIKVTDIIVSINSQEFNDENELTDFIKSQNPGQNLAIKIFRKDKLIDINATIGEKN